MSSDRLGGPWWTTPAASAGGGSSNSNNVAHAGRQLQQQQQHQQQQASTAHSPPPLRPAGNQPTPQGTARSGATAAPAASDAASPEFADVTAVKHVDPTAAMVTGGVAAGYRSMGSAAPYASTHVGGYFRSSRQQQSLQAWQWAFPNGMSLSSSSTNTSTHHSNNRSGHGAAAAYAMTTTTGLVAGGGDGQHTGGPVQYRGGGSRGGREAAGGGGGEMDHAQRRRSESGRGGGGQHGEPFQAPRRHQQQQRQQQQYASSSQRSQHSRSRGAHNSSSNSVTGCGGFGGSDTGVHSRIPSSSSGLERVPLPPVGSSEAEAGHASSEPPSTSSPHPGPAARGSPTANTVAAAVGAAPPLPFTYGGSSARRGSTATAISNGGGAAAAAAANRLVTSTDSFHPQHSPSTSNGAAAVNATAAAAAAASTTSPPSLPSSQQQQQQKVSSVGLSRPGASATTTAVVAAPRCSRPRGEERPTVALSQNIMSVYQTINEIFYQERQKLLAAPAKYAARKYEDTSGHYVPCEGEIIADRYVFKELVGQGSFGKVLHCVDRKYNEPVAVKVIRSGPYFESQGWFEAQVVAHLNNDPSLQNLVVQLRKVFMWKGHMVLVFEPLSFSLYKLITLTKHNGVSLDLTRKFAYQMVKVLLVLEQHQPPIIHCDLKPENVLLRDPSRSGVRVIDFGSACYQQRATWRLPPPQVALPASSPSSSAGPPWDAAAAVADERRGGLMSTTTTTASAAQGLRAPSALSDKATAAGGGEASTGDAAGPTQQKQQQQRSASAADAASTTNVSDVEVVMPKYIQSRYYRSPEVILELGYTTAIDRWSLGCFLTEMHTGRPLFQGNNEADMIAYFTMVLGPLPDYMIASSPKRTRLYHTCSLAESGSSGGDPASGASPLTLGGPPDTNSSAAAATAPAFLQQQQQQQRTASPLLAFTTSPPPPLTPFTEARGHAPGSPFFLRAAQVEDTESATAYAVRADGRGTPLEKVLGVYTGGPRGCRAGQPGHDEAAYITFYDFIDKLLQYDPRKRMSCAQAIQHPFLEPIRVLEARASAAAMAAGAAASPTPPQADASSQVTGDSGPSAPPGAAAAGASTVAAAPPPAEKNNEASRT